MLAHGLNADVPDKKAEYLKCKATVSYFVDVVCLPFSVWYQQLPIYDRHTLVWICQDQVAEEAG